MKSQIGLEFIQSQSEGRLTHTVAGSLEAHSPENAGEKSTADPTELVPVVVHVERGALDALLQKNGG